MEAVVNSVAVRGVLLLCVTMQEDAFAKALAIPGQTVIQEQHLTLVRLDDLGVCVPENVALPAPPKAIDMDEQVYMVDTGAKQSCYLVATRRMQEILQAYTVQCLSALGVGAGALDAKRIFHVTVSNGGGGEVRASVGAPWEFVSTPL